MTLLHDLRYAVRLLTKSPGFTAVAVLSLALGIGANTTIFSILNAVLLNPLPIKESARVMAIFTTDERNQGGLFGGTAPTSRVNLLDYREKNEVFEDMAIYSGVGLNLAGGTDEPAQIFGEIVSGSYFTVLGVNMALGRAFLPDEDVTPGAKLVCVLSYAAWQNRFGGDPSILSRPIFVNGQSFTVVGVAPDGFKGLNAIGAPVLWAPLMTHTVLLSGFQAETFDSRRALGYNAVGRLKAGVSQDQALANLRAIGAQLAQAYPTDNADRNVTLKPAAEATIFPGFRNFIVLGGAVLMTVVSLVLLIACANVANLLLARAASRQREVAIRLSMGASRGRLVRQLLTESLLLAIVGGIVGLLIAYWAQEVIWSYRPPFLQADAIDLRPAGRVLAFAMGVSLVTGLLFGSVPALKASRPDLVNELKERTSAPTGANRLGSVRNVLVIGQVALSVVALIGAGLFVRSLQETQRIDPGFDVDRLDVLTVNLGAQGYTEPRGREFQRQMIEQVQALPGVQRATVSDLLPLGGGTPLRTVFLEGQDASDRRAGKFVQVASIGDKYFDTMGIPLLRGRDFNESDREDSRPVVIINERMAEQFWPGDDAIGKRFRFFGQELNEVVGIARTSKYNFVGEGPQPFVYRPIRQVYQTAVTLFVRSAGAPGSVLGAVRAEVQRMDANLPLIGVSSLHDVLSQSMWASRLAAWLLGVFAGLSLVLAVIGLYGVMAYSVHLRTREMGIRIALGADPTSVRSLVVLQGMRLTLVGLGIGIAIAFALSGRVATLLVGVDPQDPTTYAAIALALAAAAFVATYIPARRATRIDPMTALRQE